MSRKKREPDPLPKPKRRAPGTGTVGVRSNGRIFVVLPKDLDPDRKALYGPGQRVPFASAGAATAWLDAEIVRRRAPSGASPADEMLGAYLPRWYRMHEDEWPERTLAAYRTSLRRWQIIGGIRLGALTRDVVTTAHAELRRATWQRVRKDGSKSEPRKFSTKTIQHAVALLHQALEDLVPDVLPYNPAKLRRRGRGEQQEDQPVWTREQVDAFMAMAEKHEPRFALGYRLILYRALRIGEVVALKRSDIQPAAMALAVDETAGISRGTDGPTKTRRVRDVPLSADLLARLQAHRREYPATDPHLFTLNGRPLWIEYFRVGWRRIIKLAELPPITPKDGRATCATLLLDDGWPLPVVAQLLGHSSIATTSRFYARVLKRRAEQMADIGERIDASLERPKRDDQAENQV